MILVSRFQIVIERIGIHLQHLVSQESIVWILHLNTSQLGMQIVFKAFLLLWSIELGEALFFPEHIRSYVVVGIQPIVTVDDMVYMVGKSGKEFRLGHLVRQTIHPFVNGIASLIMDMT